MSAFWQVQTPPVTKNRLLHNRSQHNTKKKEDPTAKWPLSPLSSFPFKKGASHTNKV